MTVYQAMMVLPAAYLLDRYKLHQEIYSLLERGTDERDFLYAVQANGTLLVRSARLPEYLQPQALPVTTPEAGQDVFFKVEMRAEYNAWVGEKKRHKPILARDEERWRPWMTAKLEAAGLNVQSLYLEDYQVFEIKRPGSRDFNASHALFVGRASVNDGWQLAQAMKNGIGRGKAYGTGLLQVSTKE